MTQALLLIIFTVFVLVSATRLAKRNFLFAGAYLFLYVYSIFVLIGYHFIPELSIVLGVYFGEEYWFGFYIFNFLSFLTFYLLCSFTNLNAKKRYSVVRVPKAENFALFTFLIVIIVLYLFIYFTQNYQRMNYQNASDPDWLTDQGVDYLIFGLMFKKLAPLAVIVYAQWRLKRNQKWISHNRRYTLMLLFLTLLILLMVISSQLGNRTDLLALVLGIFAFEYYIGLDFRKTMKLLCGLAVFSILLIYIKETRTQEISNDLNIVEQILSQDYYGPGHMLFAAIANNYIKPAEVIISNFSNSLVGFDYPYLQKPLTDIFLPGASSRSQSFGFYLFTEGFIFMGYAGFIYNAVVLYIGLSVWNYIASSDNRSYNAIILALMCTQLANLARTQSSYFIKDIYMIFIPLLILVYWSSGLRPKFFSGRLRQK